MSQQYLGDHMITLSAGQMEGRASLRIRGVWVRVKVVEQGNDCGVLLVPHRGQEGIVDVSVRVVVLQCAILQISHNRVHAGQVLETLLDVGLLPDLLVKVVRFLVDRVRVLGVHWDAFCGALA